MSALDRGLWRASGGNGVLVEICACDGSVVDSDWFESTFKTLAELGGVMCVETGESDAGH